MLQLQGLGPKKVKRLHDELGLDSIEKLEAAYGGRFKLAKLNSDESPVDPQRMCREVRDWLSTLGDSIVIGDAEEPADEIGERAFGHAHREPSRHGVRVYLRGLG